MKIMKLQPDSLFFPVGCLLPSFIDSSHSGSGDTTTPATPEPGMISNRLCEQSAIQQLKD